MVCTTAGKNPACHCLACPAVRRVALAMPVNIMSISHSLVENQGGLFQHFNLIQWLLRIVRTITVTFR